MKLTFPRLPLNDQPETPAPEGLSLKWLLAGLAAFAAAACVGVAILFVLTLPFHPRQIDGRRARNVVQTILGVPLPDGVVVEKCAVMTVRDSILFAKLSADVVTWNELEGRLPEQSKHSAYSSPTGPGSLPWFELPTVEHDLANARFRLHVSRPDYGVVTVLVEGWPPLPDAVY